ncbi:MAG: response regulator [Anaerolineales bacterium]|nr:response regulator [Anaerolineales bacterium]
MKARVKKLLDMLRSDIKENELGISISNKLIITVGVLYLGWHFVATLGFPQIFSPYIWISTMTMLVTTLLALRLINHYYHIAHTIWILGLVITILEMYARFQLPEIMLFLAFIPMMAIVTTGYFGTTLVEIFIIILIASLPRIELLPVLPTGYGAGVILGSFFIAFLGWSISSNMLSAIEASSYHYYRARDLLDETRIHRAEISKMLKERTKINYQLERLNKMLQAATIRAEEARAQRDRFILAISHELRNPLNFIIGFSDLMVNSPETYADTEKWPSGLYTDIQEIYQSSTHLLGLINDILDMGQIDAQGMSIFRDDIYLEEIVSEVQVMVERAFQQKGLYLTIEIEPDLPMIFVDRTRIRQVLINLINNSLRFTDQGGVTICAKRMDDCIQVSVEDTGAGIASRDIPKIFEDFRQADADNWRRREGTGLGLPISRRFVELHGGKMWLDSTLGKGTRFFFTIPILQPPQDPEKLASPDNQEDNPETQKEQPEKIQKLILLFSPNPLMHRMARNWLESYQVASYENLDDIQIRVKRHLPQAIFIDKVLLDSGQTISSNELPYPIPIISFHTPGFLGRTRQLPEGISDYLVKPIQRQVLIETVSNLGEEVKTLLVTEDDPAMVRFIKQALKSSDSETRIQDYQILSAQSGEETIRIISEQQIDAILLDLRLPDMHGWIIMDYVLTIPSDRRPKVVIISAEDLPQVLFTQGQNVLDITLNRPLSQTELPEILNALTTSIRPVYPKSGDLISSGKPEAPSA